MCSVGGQAVGILDENVYELRAGDSVWVQMCWQVGKQTSRSG